MSSSISTNSLDDESSSQLSSNEIPSSITTTGTETKPIPHLYEQLGAPVVLYRHKPSYSTPSTTSSMYNNPAIPSERSDPNDIQSKLKEQYSLISGNHVDIESLHPPQPWNRNGPRNSMFQTKSSNCGAGHYQSANDVTTDAKHCVNLLKRADRARVKTFFNSSLKYQKWHLEEINVDFFNSSSIIHDDSNSSKNAQFPMLNGIPIDKTHYVTNKKKYDSSDYILLPHRKQIDHLLLANSYKQQRMFASPLESYCAPFSTQGVRYCMLNESESQLIDRNYGVEGKNKNSNENIEEKSIQGEKKAVILLQREDLNVAKDGENYDSTNSQQIESVHTSASKDERKKDFKEMNNNGSDSDKSSSDEESDDETVKASPYTLKKEPVKKKKKKRPKLSHGQKECVSEIIHYHGNSLAVIPCICKGCIRRLKKEKNDDDHNDENEIGPNYFLLHPTGESVSLSFIHFPNSRKRYLSDDSTNDNFSSSGYKKPQIDVGGRILQIDSCTDTHCVMRHSINDENFAWTFVVRTAMHCSVIAVKLNDRPSVRRKQKKTPNKSSEEMKEICTGDYSIIEICRVPLNSDDDKFYHEQLYLATQKHIDACDGAYFAIVSSKVGKNSEHYHHYKRQTNIIHTVQVHGSGSRVSEHCIESLKDLSHIQYSASHPMVLWAAARSNAEPNLYKGKGAFNRPMIGYGHSLYTIDLRCDKANFTWSPSFEELMMDGIHSVSGILTDASNPYRLYTKSLSAGGRLYEIDSRMPSRSVFSWGLPGLGDDFKSRLPLSSMYGPGVLMAQPLDLIGFSNETIQIPVLCVNKTSATYGVQLYQRPFNYPRFRTRNLEAPMATGLGLRLNTTNESNISCFATSSSYPLCDSTNVKGLASFFVSSKQIHSRLDNVGYDTYPEKALCVITENQVGDLYGQTLLAVPHTETKQARIVKGGKVGSCAVEIPCYDNDDYRPASYLKQVDIFWRLDNQFPCDSQSVLKQHVMSRQQCRNFESVQLGHLPRQKNEEMVISKVDNVSLAHPLPSTQLGGTNVTNIPQNLKLNAKYFQGIEESTARESRSDGSFLDTNNFPRDCRTDLDEGCLKKLKEAWVMEQIHGNDDASF